MRRIAANAGAEGSVVVDEVRRRQRETGNPNVGYDANLNEYGDLVQGGIIDPAKVTRAALENAASVAAMVLTTDSLVTDVPENREEAEVGGHDHHHH